MKYVQVKFLSTRDAETADSYTYESGKLKLERFDIVLVPTRYGFSIAYVTDVLDEPNINRYYSNRIVNIKKVAEKLKSKVIEAQLKDERRKELEKQIEKRIKQLDKQTSYERYADVDSDMAALVAQFKELNK